LQTDDADLETLGNLLQQPEHRSAAHALDLIETYVEMHENISRSRELIIERLVEFQRIMEEFLVGKTVKLSAREGIVITGATGKLKENDLSSGEYHFLYMMVAALLCQRVGTILAIDEPELSLHVSWQRRLVRALSRCASGASPLFFLATHSTAISAEHADKVITLSAID
jgi:ABC-type glutathione transport system ATPase component